MTETDPQRRTFLATAAASVAVGLAGVSLPMDPVRAAVPTPPPGKPGEFDFLAGAWRIRHRRLKPGGDWDEFGGEATCWTILGGVGSVEDLRIPERDFSGLGLRLLDVEKKVWSDFWVNAKSGALATPGLTGGFRDGVGTFVAEEDENGARLLSRGVWDRITPNSCRWHQAVSRDDGRTWATNWTMEWTRVPARPAAGA